MIRTRVTFWRWVNHAIALGTLLGLFLLPGRVQADSIFDDNWTPPVRPKNTPLIPPPPTTLNPPDDPATPETPETKSDQPPVAPPVTPPPAEAAPPLQPNPADAGPKRIAIPPHAEQTRTRKLFKEVFAKELAQHAPAPRRALATKLLEEAAKSKDAVTDQYVLLVGAAQAAKEASDLSLYCRAADALAGAYDIDGLRMKTDAAASMKLHADTPSAADGNCAAGLKLVEQAIKDEDFATAGRILSALRQVPPRGPMIAAVQDRARVVDAVRANAERVAPFLKKLKTSPADPEANLMVGQYYCFDKGDWKKGLPLLAKGPKNNITGAAILDLASAKDPSKYAGMGEAWWSLAESEKSSRQLSIRQRAVRFYSMAINSGTATGLQRIQFEKRIAATPQPLTGEVRIVSARWGGGSNWSNVTARISELVESGEPFWANCPTLNADPTPGWRKHLDVTYIKYGVTKSLSVDEDQAIPMADFAP